MCAHEEWGISGTRAFDPRVHYVNNVDRLHQERYRSRHCTEPQIAPD
jgi:hypothetical protein